MSKIAINPGHHIRLDPGAVGPGGLREADVAMTVARKVETILAAVGHNMEFICANELETIVDAANTAGADIFVSIHCNGYDDPAAHGTETWCYEDSPPGYRLARAIQTELVTTTGLVNRGVRLSPGLHVLKHTNMPAALVELAFITNPAEEALLATEAYQDAAAKAVASGIEKYLNGGM